MYIVDPYDGGLEEDKNKDDDEKEDPMPVSIPTITS